MVTRPRSVESKCPQLIHSSLLPSPTPQACATHQTHHQVLGTSSKWRRSPRHIALSRHIATLYRVTAIIHPKLAFSPALRSSKKDTQSSVISHEVTGTAMPRASGLVFGPSCAPIDMGVPWQNKRGKWGLLPLLVLGNTPETQL